MSSKVIIYHCVICLFLLICISSLVLHPVCVFDRGKVFWGLPGRSLSLPPSDGGDDADIDADDDMRA